MTIHSENMAVISTAHLPEDEASRMNDAILSGEVNGMQRDHGWLVHTHGPYDNFMALNFVLGYLLSKGFDWVLFDSDAEIADELPTYEW